MNKLTAVLLLLAALASVTLAVGSVRVGDTNYPNIQAALDSATSGSVLTVSLTGDFSHEHITIGATAKPHTVVLAGSSAVTRAVVSANISIANLDWIELRNLVIDGGNDDSVHIFEHCLHHTDLVIDNVVVRNFAAPGALCFKAHLENLETSVTNSIFDNCAGPVIIVSGIGKGDFSHNTFVSSTESDVDFESADTHADEPHNQ
jgi:hypothetical protein